MKKSILAIGLLSMVMVLTSFTTTETSKVIKSTAGADLKSNVTLAYGGGSGSQGAGKVIKKD